MMVPLRSNLTEKESAILIMRRSVWVFLLILYLFISLGESTGQTQCRPSAYALACIENMDKELVYLKSYNIDGGEGSVNRVEYTAVMGKNMHYVLYICTATGDADGIMLSISDPDRRVVAANTGADKPVCMLEFPCTSTGIYYLTFTFRNSIHFCGSCVIAVRRSNGSIPPDDG